jgi:hypothetical protein
MMTILPLRAVSFSSWIGKSAMVTKIVVDGKSKKNLARHKKGKGRDQAQIVVEG